MKNIFLGIIIVIFLLFGNTFAQTKNDEKAINALIGNAIKALDVNDIDKFGNFLTENCIHVNPWGEQIDGREAIVKHFKGFHQKEGPKLEILEKTFKFITADTALITILFKEGNQTFREIVFVAKVKNDWKISSFQGIDVKEPPKSPGK